MKKYFYLYKDVISNKISDSKIPHPLYNSKDKSYFLKFLLKDLYINKYFDISDNKNNLFRINFDNLYYTIFIEFPDGGGMDVSKNKTSKKVSIPFNQKAFKKIINNFERVLVINIYIPLSSKYELNLNDRVYLIVKPREIYSSKVIYKKSNNSSSRWFKLEDIIEILNTRSYKLNNKKNIYIVHHSKLKWFFNSILKEEYMNMINDELNSFNLDNFIKKNDNQYNKYRKLFREKLIASRGIKCEFNNCNINNLELMVASHIKPVNEIINDDLLTKDEKINEIIDINNGFLLCPNHDALFDKYLITFDKFGYIKVSKNIKPNISEFKIDLNNKSINISNDNVLNYLKCHNDKFKSKNNN